MARAKVTKHYNSFLNGKVSDGNEFSAPENAVRDSLNMELQQDDSFRRRRGLTFGSLVVQSALLRTLDSQI